MIVGGLAFSGENGEGQPVLTWWQRTGRERCESARWIVSAVEIDQHQSACIWLGHFQKTPRHIRVVARGSVTEHYQVIVFARFLYYLQAIFGSRPGEHHCTGRGQFLNIARDVLHTKNPSFREKLKITCDPPLGIV